MQLCWTRRRWARFLTSILCCGAFFLQGICGSEWTQFGGPNRNFTVDAGPLATNWDGKGPRILWSRELGDGFSSILFEDGRLYTMHRDGEQDVVVALNADTGETSWATSYDSPTQPDMILDFGPGPIVTPALSGDYMFTVSSTVKLHCLNKKTGQIIWARDLMRELAATHMGRGYGPSPLIYGNLLIMTVGGDKHGVVAFDQKTGEIVWKTISYGPSYSAPILIEVDGEEQLVAAMSHHRLGLDPQTGEIDWDLELPLSARTMMATQLWGSDQLLFGSSAYADGSRAIEVRKVGETFQANELWYSRKLRVMFPSFVRIGDYVYGSSGDFGPAILVAMNVKNGEVAWRKRGFARTHFLHADGKVVLLDEEGDLAIATATPVGLEIHCRAPVIGRTAWTPPTLVGTRLFVRNRSEIRALELGLNQ